MPDCAAELQAKAAELLRRTGKTRQDKTLVAQLQIPFKLHVTCDKGPLPPERKHRTEGSAEAKPRRNN